MDKIANLAKEMPTNTLPSVGSFYPPPEASAPPTNSANSKATNSVNKPANSANSKATNSANSKATNSANKPTNARPAPEIVTVIEAANSAVNGSAKKVAALLENPQVVKAAQNLVDKITPAKANPAPSKNANAKNANAKNANVKNTTVKNTTKKNPNSDEPTENDPTLAGNNKKGKYLNNKGKPVGTMVGGRKTRKGKKKSRSRR